MKKKEKFECCPSTTKGARGKVFKCVHQKNHSGLHQAPHGSLCKCSLCKEGTAVRQWTDPAYEAKDAFFEKRAEARVALKTAARSYVCQYLRSLDMTPGMIRISRNDMRVADMQLFEAARAFAKVELQDALFNRDDN